MLKAGVVRACMAPRFLSGAPSPARTDCGELVCDVDAEPLHRYRPGGYHPLRLGDTLGDGRYKVFHKLGWGGYSTVWAARDQRFCRLSLTLMCGADRHQGSQMRCSEDLCLGTGGATARGQSHACCSSVEV